MYDRAVKRQNHRYNNHSRRINSFSSGTKRKHRVESKMSLKTGNEKNIDNLGNQKIHPFTAKRTMVKFV